jgi:hypothetical protein
MNATRIVAEKRVPITLRPITKHTGTNISVQSVGQFAFVFHPMKMRVVEIDIGVMDFS